MNLSSFEGFIPSVTRLLAGTRGTVLCAVSGGGDSVALACTMALYARTAPVTPILIHVNHGIRGKNADEDEAFVQELAEMLGLPFRTFHGNVPQAVALCGGGLEEAARKLRYGFFEKAMAESGAACLLLAHHEGDLAENVLLHLIRGCGLDGLCGMPEKARFGNGFLARPFLHLPKEALLEALQKAGIPWRTDETNLVADCTRNRVRLEVLPLLEQLRPGAARAIASSACVLCQDQAYLEEMTGAFLARGLYSQGGYCILNRELFSLLHPALKSRVLRSCWRKATGAVQESALSRDATESLLSFCEGEKGSMQLYGSVTVLLSQNAIRFMSPCLVPQLPALERLPFQEYHGDGKMSQAFPAQVLEGAVLRTRQEGDWIVPFGGTERKLKDYLSDAHMENVLRPDTPVLAKGNEILWVIGVGASARAKISPGEEGILLRCKDEIPFLSKVKTSGGLKN